MEKVNDKIYNYITNNELEIETIMKEYNHYIYTIINRSSIMFLKEDKEEIILDVYLTLWNNKEKLNMNKSMTAYIAGITKNLILKKIRQQKHIENIEDYQERLTSKLIINELEKMKKEDREIFMAYYYEERKIKEIAIMFKISESKVKSKLFRTRNKLKKILKKGGYEVNG